MRRTKIPEKQRFPNISVVMEITENPRKHRSVFFLERMTYHFDEAFQFTELKGRKAPFD